MSYEAGFADVNGAKLYYEAAGEGHPVVLIHGGLVHSALWDREFELLSHEYRVIRYDARQHGRSEPVPGPFYHHKDLRELMSFLGVERAHLVGLSMGGGIALEVALQYPEVVTSLALVASGTDDHGWSQEIMSSWERVGEAYEAGDLEGAVEVTLRTWTDGPGREPEEVDATARERVGAMTAYNFALPDADSEEVELYPPPLSRLSEVRVPTLVVVGTEDVDDIQEIAASLESGIPGAKRVQIEDTAHHLNLERPEEFDEALLDFLGSVEE